MRKRLRLFLFSLVVAVVSAEALLQLGYFVTWVSRPGRQPMSAHADSARTILCVGDSFTYGMGASSPQQAYPAQLAEVLRRETGAQWHVENRGWPGRMSREILESIDGWLAETRPRFLCIVVGCNDAWRRPDELVLPADAAAATPIPAGEPYVWTFRLGRLIAAFHVRDPFRDQPPAQPAADPATNDAGPPREAVTGDWVLCGPDVALTFHADGGGSLGTEPLQWHLDDGQLTVTCKSLPPITGVCRIADRAMVLTVRGAPPLQFVRPAEGPVIRNPAAEGWRAMDVADYAKAEAAFLEAIAEAPPDDPWTIGARAGLASALVARSKRDEALAQLDLVRKAHATQNDVRSIEALVLTLTTLGFAEEGAALVERAIPSHPESPTLWSMYSSIAAERGDKATARTAIDKSLELAAKAGWTNRGYQLWAKALLHRESADDAPAFADCAVATHLETGQDARVRQLLWTWLAPPESKEPALRAACEARGLPAARRDALLRLLREANGEGSAQWQAVLKSHVRQVIHRSRRAGCEPVLGTYPLSSDVRWVFRALAAEENCAFVEIDTAVAAIEQKEPQRVLKVADGHCNDAGYAVMAGEFARAIVAATNQVIGPRPAAK